MEIGDAVAPFVFSKPTAQSFPWFGSGDKGKLFIGGENGSVVLLDISVSKLMFVYS